jgi:hypothetical protein
VIGGFLALALGPEGVGRLADSNGIFPDQTFAVWKALPGLLINVMSASLLLGERLPAPRKIWGISRSHVIMAGIMSAGQFAVADLAVLAVLRPGFDFSDKGGALIEVSFAGGHGTLAGLGPVFKEYGAGDLVEVGLGLATIGHRGVGSSDLHDRGRGHDGWSDHLGSATSRSRTERGPKRFVKPGVLASGISRRLIHDNDRAGRVLNNLLAHRAEEQAREAAEAASADDDQRRVGALREQHIRRLSLDRQRFSL